VSGLKDRKIGVITLLVIGLVIGLTGIVCADPGVNATPETQLLSTVTTADVVGSVMEHDAATWTLTEDPFADDPDVLEYETDLLHPFQVQYTTAYDATIVAQGGQAVLIKNMNIDTRNKVASQSNIKAQTGLTFAATEGGGNVVGSENLMLDGAGNYISASERMFCPFVSQDDSIIPAFCNIVQAGSTYDLAIGSVTTNADERFVGTDSTVPVVLNYAVTVKPYGTTQGQIPASGSTSAYIKTHIQEARDIRHILYGANLYGERAAVSEKTEDLTYTETGSAQGTITSFNKVMSYSSQVTSVAARHYRVV